MNPAHFSAVVRSLTLAISVLGMMGVTLIQAVRGHFDAALTTTTLTLLGAFTGAHLTNTANGNSGLKPKPDAAVTTAAPADTTIHTEVPVK